MNLKENEILRCFKCGSLRFHVTAHVCQDWEVDEKGAFQKCTDECSQVIHTPDGTDSFTCAECGHDAEGQDFVMSVDRKRSYDRLCALLTAYEGNGSSVRPSIEDLRAEAKLLIAEWPIITGKLPPSSAELEERHALVERLKLMREAQTARTLHTVLWDVASKWETIVTANRED